MIPPPRLRTVPGTCWAVSGAGSPAASPTMLKDGGRMSADVVPLLPPLVCLHIYRNLSATLFVHLQSFHLYDDDVMKQSD